MQKWEYMTVSYGPSTEANKRSITISPSNKLDPEWVKRYFPEAKLLLNDFKDLLIRVGTENWPYGRYTILNYFGSLGWEAYAAESGSYGSATVFLKRPLE